MNSSSHSRKLWSVCAGLFLSLVSVSISAAEYMTPEYARAEFRPKTMVLIPPRAEVTKNKVTSTEQMIEAGSVLEDATSLALKEQFGELGYEIRILSVDEVNADPELQLMVRNLNERYDADLAQVLKKRKDVRKRRFSFGDEARILAARLGAEAIIVGRIQASGATGGQQAMSFLIGGSSGYAAMSLGIIAGDNGDLEAFFNDIDTGMSPAQITEQPLETMAKVSAKVLKDYPAMDETAKVRRSWPQSTDRKVADTALSDEELFSDLEALFEEEAEDVIPDEELPVDEATEAAAEPAN